MRPGLAHFEKKPLLDEQERPTWGQALPERGSLQLEACPARERTSLAEVHAAVSAHGRVDFAVVWTSKPWTFDGCK